MADNLIDARVLARRQKDIDGFTEKYQTVVDARTARFAKEIGPIWYRTAQRVELEMQQLILEYTAGKDILPEWKLSGLRNRVKRLNTLYNEIRLLIKDTEGPLNEKLGRKLAYTCNEAYLFNAFGVEQAAKIAISVPLLTYNQVMGVLSNPWLPDGNTYSDRIRANTAYLAGKMKNAIGRAVSEGWAWNRTAQEIKKTAQEGYYNSVRLARTELNRAANQGASQLYMENADILDGKRWNATLDRRTAPKDAANDGNLYPLEYDTPEMPGAPGERIPNHPNCRCKYSPVLSALGVSTKERFSRGDGQTADSWGERTYTKARTYREYAKERGLPDLDDRLENDDPKRYLRRGETMADYSKKAPKVSLPVTASAGAAAVTWTEQVKARIAQGVNSEGDARAVGGMVRQEIEQTVSKAKEEITQELVKLNKEITDLEDQLYGDNRISDPDKYIAVRQKVAGLRVKNLELQESLSGKRAATVKEKLAEVRPMGKKGRTFAKGSSVDAKKAIDGLHDHIPTKWLELSDAAPNPLMAKKSDRGYYNERKHKKVPGTGKWVKKPGGGMDYISTQFEIVAEISLSQGFSAGGFNGLQRCALHELGHRFEDVVPGIKQLEYEFYQRRTAGESLQWLGPGYKQSEKARFDKFQSPYMGKDYGNKPDSFYELLSMGIEGLYTGKYDMFDDTDFTDFILGVMASI